MPLVVIEAEMSTITPPPRQRKAHGQRVGREHGLRAAEGRDARGVGVGAGQQHQQVLVERAQHVGGQAGDVVAAADDQRGGAEFARTRQQQVEALVHQPRARAGAGRPTARRRGGRTAPRARRRASCRPTRSPSHSRPAGRGRACRGRAGRRRPACRPRIRAIGSGEAGALQQIGREARAARWRRRGERVVGSGHSVGRRVRRVRWRGSQLAAAPGQPAEPTHSSSGEDGESGGDQAARRRPASCRRT